MQFSTVFVQFTRTKREHSKKSVIIFIFWDYLLDFRVFFLYYSMYMINKETNNNNLIIVRNIVYSSIKKINKKIKEEIEVDPTLLNMIDINMKNAINKIINNYKEKKQQ